VVYPKNSNPRWATAIYGLTVQGAQQAQLAEMGVMIRQQQIINGGAGTITPPPPPSTSKGNGGAGPGLGNDNSFSFFSTQGNSRVWPTAVGCTVGLLALVGVSMVLTHRVWQKKQRERVLREGEGEGEGEGEVGGGEAGGIGAGVGLIRRRDSLLVWVKGVLGQQ